MATSNKSMGDMMRTRRKQMMDESMGGPYSGPPDETAEEDTEEASETSEEKFKVAAPGEPSTGEQFEYEPMLDIPGAWVVYPPGVPCDDAEYRVQMDSPADKDDFPNMEKAITDAGGNTSESAEPASVAEGAEQENY